MTRQLPPCISNPQGWDLDFGGFREWTAAIAGCGGCPRLEECQADLDALPRRDRPAGVIWAGTAYGEKKQPLDLIGLKRRSERRRNAVPEDGLFPATPGLDAA